MNNRARRGVIPVVGASGCDDVADTWLTSYRRPLLGFVLPYVSGDVQAVIVELFFQRKSVADVAALLAIPEGTVRSRCFYGLRALRRELEKQGITGCPACSRA